jgi:hypothetical protein
MAWRLPLTKTTKGGETREAYVAFAAFGVIPDMRGLECVSPATVWASSQSRTSHGRLGFIASRFRTVTGGQCSG